MGTYGWLKNIGKSDEEMKAIRAKGKEEYDWEQFNKGGEAYKKGCRLTSDSSFEFQKGWVKACFAESKP